MFTNKQYPIELKQKLYDMAVKKTRAIYGDVAIYPISTRDSFDDCFTIDDDVLIFWYDVDIGCGRSSGITMTDMDKGA